MHCEQQLANKHVYGKTAANKQPIAARNCRYEKPNIPFLKSHLPKLKVACQNRKQERLRRKLATGRGEKCAPFGPIEILLDFPAELNFDFAREIQPNFLVKYFFFSQVDC